MAISHVCNSCGVDLARVRSFIDPSLNLPIVVCPECDCAVVRRRHPIHAFWRRARRADSALSALVLQVIIGSALLGTIAGMTTGLANMAGDRAETPLGFVMGAFGDQESVRRVGTLAFSNDDGRATALLVTVIFSAIAGIWLTATTTHLGFVRRWSVWTGLLLGFGSVNWLAWAYGAGVAIAIGEPALTPPTGAGMWLNRLMMLAGCIAVMLIASPIGLPARWILGLLHSAMWRRQLKKTRRSRGWDE